MSLPASIATSAHLLEIRNWPELARKLGWSAFRVLGISWICIFALVAYNQRTLMYLPLVGTEGPAQFGLADVSAETLKTPDGETLTVWTRAAAPGKPTILYFHGNAGWWNGRAVHFPKFAQEGWGLNAISYRSFAGSTGSPTESALVSDAKLAYDALRRRGVAESDIVIYGESLGTGVAVQVAAARRVAAVVLESPFSSTADVAFDKYWYLPVSLAMQDTFMSTTYVQKVAAPILILAGTTDDIVPAKFARKLFAAIPGPKRYVEYPKGGHVDLFTHGAFDEVRTWLAAARNGP